MWIKAQDGREISDTDLIKGFEITANHWGMVHPTNEIWISLRGDTEGKSGILFHHRDDYIFSTITKKFNVCYENGDSFDFQEELRQLEEWRDDVINNPDMPF